MTVIIQESQVLAELIPEVNYYMDSDAPASDELLSSVSKYLSKLVLKAFHQLSVEMGCSEGFDPDWLKRIRNDPALIALAVLEWTEVHVLDSEGTIIIITRETITHVK